VIAVAVTDLVFAHRQNHVPQFSICRQVPVFDGKFRRRHVFVPSGANFRQVAGVADDGFLFEIADNTVCGFRALCFARSDRLIRFRFVLSILVALKAISAQISMRH
jgi:hypothetical protein